ncbi:hypothetical protein Tco_0854316, partial [Tanacetum coccineum]
ANQIQDQGPTITHYLCNLIISEFDCTQEFTDEIGELRAISGHVLRATGVQIPEDDLDNQHSLREVDGTRFNVPRASFYFILRITTWCLLNLIIPGIA